MHVVLVDSRARRNAAANPSGLSAVTASAPSPRQMPMKSILSGSPSYQPDSPRARKVTTEAFATYLLGNSPDARVAPVVDHENDDLQALLDCRGDL